DELFDHRLHIVGDLAKQGALSGRQLANLAHSQRDQTSLAEILDPQLVNAFRLIQGGQGDLDFAFPGFKLRLHSADTVDSCALAMTAICPKASGSRTASSESVLRSNST